MSEGESIFDFAVPDELLREAVQRRGAEELVADVKMMPGTGEGKLPPLIGILKQYGYAPLVLLTLAAFVPSLVANGISIIAKTLEHTFHVSNAGLAAMAFVAQVAQLLWAVPLALWADRGSRRFISAVALLTFCIFGTFMSAAPNAWVFAFLYFVASVGLGMGNTVHNSLLTDAYPIEGRGRVFSWHNLQTPLSNTFGILIFGLVVQANHNDWRYGILLSLVGIPIALGLFRIKEPKRGSNEASHILKAAGMDIQSQQEKAPRVLLGSAVTRLLRIRSLYYELIAIAILGFASTGAPLFDSLFFADKYHLSVVGRTHVYFVIGLAAFLGLPVAYIVGDRFFRKNPQKPLIISGICISAYGILFVASLYVPHLWECVALQTIGNASVQPLAICIFLTLAATAPPEMRTICFAMFGVTSLVFGGFLGSVGLGIVSDHLGGGVRGIVDSLTSIAPVCVIGGLFLIVGSRHVKRDITMVIEDVLERYEEGRRRQAGGEIPALQIHDLDFYYGTNQVLFGVNLEVQQGEMVALLGTNGAGKSTLLRAVAGLDHPHRGVIRLFGITSTYLESEQVITQGVGFLLGGKMTFPGLSVRDNLKIGAQSFRKDRARAAKALDEAMDVFPELAERIDQPAGTLSGGEQQMLAVARVMMTKPRLLLIDELSLGLAPKTVDRLMGIVREINHSGTTVVIVEQSINRAAHLAEHAFFLERGEVRFDGSTKELLDRHDLLRPVFLAAAGTGLDASLKTSS